MGLDIHPRTSKKGYHASYHALHGVRWLALISAGFPENIGDKKESSYRSYPGYYVIPNGLTADNLKDMVHAAVVAGHLYPNLMLHSDCEGSYTKRGKVNVFGGWLTGSSTKLLAELEALKERTPARLKDNGPGTPWWTFKMLYELVKDEVKKGTGYLSLG